MSVPSYNIPISGKRSLRIQETANAWWRDPGKVCMLFAYLRLGLSAEGACRNIGISKSKYMYFVKIHPETNEIRKEYTAKILKTAEKTVKERVQTDPKFALKYLMKHKPEDFPTPSSTKRIAELEEELDLDGQEYRDEIRELKIILGIYMETYNRTETNDIVKRLVTANRLIREYNKKHSMGKKVKRIHKMPLLEQEE